MALRKGQKELVEQYRGGFCAVPAIPGGGKTHCLSQWAVEVISQGLHRPGKILIVTYMNSAVNNFKQRIARELTNRGIAGHKDYFVSTIHGLCLQIVKEKPDLVSADSEFEIVDGVERVRLVSTAIDEWRRHHDEWFRSYLEESQLSADRAGKNAQDWQSKLCGIMLTAIGEMKSLGLNPQQAVQRCKELSDTSLLKAGAEIYRVYEKRLKMNGLMDFDDMLFHAKQLLQEDAALLDKYRSRFTFVCEDEAQDSNRIQNDILTLIADGNLIRVGDSNQAICGSFTSSDFTLFKNFCLQPDTRVYTITQSSRNTRQIIDLANYFVRFVREEHPVPECRESLLPQFIEAVGPEDERPNPVIPEYGIKARIFNSWEEEAQAVAAQAGYMLQQHPGKTLAILVPSARKIGEIISRLEARGIPYEELENTSGEKNRTVRMLGRIIDFIAESENSGKLADMMDECFLRDMGQGDVEITPAARMEWQRQKEMLLGYIRRSSTESLLYPTGGVPDAAGIPPELADKLIWKEFSAGMALVRELLEFPETVIEKMILYISEKLNWGREERAIAQKVAGDVRYLMGKDPRWRLQDLALELLSPKNRFNFFAGVVWDLKGYEPRPGVITIATYHKSKGLEWDAVFLTGLNYADFPVDLTDKFIGEYWYLKSEYKNPQALIRDDIQRIGGMQPEGDSFHRAKLEIISEKARLLYVGITRAKEYLFLSGYHANVGKRNEAPPSRYLTVLKKYVEEEDGKWQ